MGSLGPSIQDQAVDELIHARIQLLSETPCSRESDTPFFVADTNKVIEQHQRWRKALPHVQPFYAVKCNPDQRLLLLLADMGVNFDCASLAEIEQVLEMGVDPCRIIFAHPCKAPSALDIAAKRGIRWTTFDNSDELDKIQRFSPGMELLLRIYVPDHGAKTPLGIKFGAHLETTRALLEKARRLELEIVGVSFHVGSGASNPDAFVTAIRLAKTVFEEGKALEFDMHMLDIGGGFEDGSFETYACPLREAISCEFPTPVTLIAEPGRFYASGFYTMICKVISRRTQTGMTGPKQPDMLYLNDGVYGCFSQRWSENGTFVPTWVASRGKFGLSLREWTPHRYSIWGPTCDSVDCISNGVVMNQEVKIGDWLRFSDMGGNTEIKDFVRKCDVVQPWVSQNVTLGDAVFNMSNILSRGANCALLDAVTLAEHITSPAYDRSLPTSLDVYVKENIECRQHVRYRSYLLQKIIFSGHNRIMRFVRDKTLPLALRRIDDLDREEHNVDETWVANEGNGLPQSGKDPQWIEELRWEEIYYEQHGSERNGDR